MARYFHIVTIIYCNYTEVNGSRYNEPSEKDKEKDTEYTGHHKKKTNLSEINMLNRILC